MKFAFTPKFWEDFRNLTARDRRAVSNAKATISQALEGNPEYHQMHRIKRMEGFSKVWEGHVKDNLCFTFHYDQTDEGERMVLFRRVGTHDIYKKP